MFELVACRRLRPFFELPLYPLPLVVFLTLIVVTIVLFVVGQPTQTSLGAAVVLLGLLISRFVI